MINKNEFKEFDFEGEETLRAISEANNFNRWMYESIKNYCKGDILEIGSGIGNISSFFIKAKGSFSVSDIREQYRSYLKQIFPNINVYNINIAESNFEDRYPDLCNKYDTVFALNVVEHINDDKRALINMLKLLKPGGILIVLVPAYQFLYNEFDSSLEHYRRYTKNSLLRIMPPNTKVLKSWYFNLAGIFGWLVVGKLARKKTIPRSNMRLYNKLTFLFKIMDWLTFNKAGLSVIVIAQKV